MTPEARAALRRQLTALDAATEKLEAARRPFDDAIRVIQEVREELIDQHEAALAGKCETCGEPILVGEKGHRFADGAFCFDCSPTWRDVKDNLTEALAIALAHDHPADNVARLREGIATAEAKIAAGEGSRRHVWEL